MAFVIAVVGQWGVVPAYASAFTPTVTTDLADYNPGGTVVLTGAGWDPAGSAVHVVVNDDDSQSWQRVVDLAVSPDGAVSDTFSLPNYFVANYSIRATQTDAGGAELVATHAFTDANPSADLDQCANDSAPSPNTNGCSASANDWVNGNVNEAKAVYLEGDSLPYRMRFDNLSLSTHTVQIEWDTTKGGKHALDYLTTFNRTVADANPCLGVTNCTTSTTFPIPADPQVTGAGVTPAAGNFTLYGGTITGVSAYSYPTGTGFTGDRSAGLTITFTASKVNPVLAWAGHISTRADWGLLNSAVAVSGSPYHTRLIALDGSGGNQDRSLSAAAVIFPGSITVIKDAVPNGSTSFGFTASPSPLTNFSLVDDGTSTNTKVFSNITNFQTYTVAEASQVAPWVFTSLSCSATSPNGGSQNVSGQTATIALKEGENVTCTYVNTRLNNPALTLIKTVTNDDGGTAVATDFTLSANGPTPISGAGGVSSTVNAGSYSLSETTLPGYAAGTWSCTGSGTFTAPATIALTYEQSAVCTINNNDIAPKLHLRKVVVNDNGGTATAADFTLTADGTGSNDLTGVTPVDSGAGLDADTWALSEAGPAGYSSTGWTCVGGTQSGSTITVGIGGEATCTITNNDIPPQLHLRKIVVNDNGGTATVANFTLTANGTGTNDISGTSPVDSGGGLQADTWALSETSPGGYTASGWSCVGGSQSGANITVGIGGSATCTITNDDVAPQLHLRKVVTNDNGGTATVADFTLTADGTGSNDLSGTSPVDSGTGLKADTWTLSETEKAGYAASAWSCVGGTQDGSKITVGLGGEATCTITNDDIAPQLHLRKILVNDNGGGATLADFVLTADGAKAGNDVSGTSPVDSGAGLKADTWALSETTVTGYAASAWVCEGGTQVDASVTLGIGEEATCTITNDDATAHLKLVKKVTNDNGGTATAADFTLSATGPTSISGAGGAEDDVDAGSYDLSETTLPDYAAGTWSCNGGTFTPAVGDVKAKIAVALGQSAVCEITNDDKAPKLHLRKIVTNDNGGTATVSDFTLRADGTDANDLSGSSPVDSLATLEADTWTLSETGPDTYTKGAWVCTGGLQDGATITLKANEEATCTIINNDKPPRLHLRKIVVNDNGGTATVADFPLTADGTKAGNDLTGTSPVDSGTGLQTDTWTLSETEKAGYSASAWSCVGGTQDGSKITVGLGGEATCTITNDDIAPKLHLRKVVTNDNGGTATVADFALTADGTGSNDLTGTSPVDSGSSLKADTWTLSEVEKAGYAASAWSCVGGTQDGSKITVGLGGEATCTITNDDIAPKLHLRKVVVNDNGGTKTVAYFTLTANGVGSNDISGTSPVDSGASLKADTWALSETAVYGYTASAWSCVGGTQNGSSITVGLGGEATCTITNDDQPGTIIVKKLAKPDQGSFAFTTTGAGYSGFTLNVPVTTQNSQTLDAGTYSVKESTQLGWILTGIGGSTDPNTPYSCVVTGSGGSTGTGDLTTQTATISLKNGDTVTCTFENTGQGVTRTQGFWATHPQLAEIAWFGGTRFGHTFPGVAATTGIGDATICGRPIDTLGKVTAAFWSDIAKTSTGKKRTALDQARMQLLQQLMAAELNASAFGSVPSGGSGMFAAWESALCGTNTNAIKNAQQQAASFNTNGDSGTFTPGTSADSKTARAIATYAFWDTFQ